MTIILEQDLSKLVGEEYNWESMYVHHGKMCSKGYVHCYHIIDKLFFTKKELSEQIQLELEKYAHAVPALTQERPSIQAYLVQMGYELRPVEKH